MTSGLSGSVLMESVLMHMNKHSTKLSLFKDTFVNRHCANLVDNGVNLNKEVELKKGGFAKAFDKFSVQDAVCEQKQSFRTLLKNSKFVDLGDAEGKVVTGTIFQTLNDDLYVDFGWKFHCVVPRPAKNGHEYVKGARVRLSIKELELSTKFLGSEKDLTLLEAEAILLGLVSSPVRSGNTSVS